MRCNECRFWVIQNESDDIHEDDRNGYCRRYPPQLNTAAIEYDTEDGTASEPIAAQHYMWNYASPVTIGCFWCGEFHARKVKRLTPSVSCDKTESPVVWLAVYEAAVKQEDVVTAARAKLELKKVGVVIMPNREATR